MTNLVSVVKCLLAFIALSMLWTTGASYFNTPDTILMMLGFIVSACALGGFGWLGYNIIQFLYDVIEAPSESFEPVAIKKDEEKSK